MRRKFSGLTALKRMFEFVFLERGLHFLQAVIICSFCILKFMLSPWACEYRNHIHAVVCTTRGQTSARGNGLMMKGLVQKGRGFILKTFLKQHNTDLKLQIFLKRHYVALFTLQQYN
jgi:hypothetical protein